MAAVTRESLIAGRMFRRLESKITEGLATEIDALAVELADGGDPTMFRSRAVRLLLVEGIIAMRDKRPARRRRVTRNG
jgi:hypothetical protein